MVRSFRDFEDAARFYNKLLEQCEDKIIILLKERQRLKELVKHNLKMSKQK